MCHAQLVLPLQLHIVLNIPGWWEGELRGPQDVKTTPVWTQSCCNIKLLSRMSDKLAVSNQQITRRQKAGTWISHAVPTQRIEKKQFSAEGGLLLLAHFPGTSMGTELSALCLCPSSTLCLWLCQCVPTQQTNPPRATTWEQQQIPALSRTQAPLQLEFYRDTEKTQLHNSACKSVKYGSMKGCT